MENVEISNIKVLLVDDDEDEYVIARDLLREIGGRYTVSWEPSYEQALEEVVKGGYDICLIDYHLGEKNGIAFIKEAAVRTAQIPIILLTRQGDHEVDLSAMRAGAVDYLDKKGLNADNLERALRYALERKRQEETIRRLAYYDQLTNLPNRVLFLDRLETALASFKRHRRRFAVMLLDLDNFKLINDTLGHFQGDELIKETARRLRACLRREDAIVRERFDETLDTVARLGGDEFTILLYEINQAENSAQVAERIKAALKKPIMLDGREISTTASIGIAVFPDDGGDVRTLLQNADLAMYDAKASGRNNFRYFNPVLDKRAQRKLSLQEDLKNAIANNQLALYFQPVFDLRSRTVTGAEALLRWTHPKHGVILPDDFIPLAEEIGLISEIDAWVLEEACRASAAWRTAGHDGLELSFNVSRAQFGQKEFLRLLLEKKRIYSLPDRALAVEISEKHFSDRVDRDGWFVADCRAGGVLAALDDFGSGLASVNILTLVSFDIIKLDRLLVSRMQESESDAAVVSSIIGIGRSLGTKVAALGIENDRQLATLRGFGCDAGQGDFLGTPVTAEALAGLLGGKS